MKKDDRIFVAGHKGLVGSAIVRTLKDRGYKRIVTKTRQECDLLNPLDVKKLFEENRIDYVFDAAARVGGIHANDTYSAEFIYENTMIQTNLIHYAYKYFVKKFCFLGSVCIYPKPGWKLSGQSKSFPDNLETVRIIQKHSGQPKNCSENSKTDRTI